MYLKYQNNLKRDSSHTHTIIYHLLLQLRQQNQEEWTTSNGYAEKDEADNFAVIDETCEFPTQRIWIITWLVANVIGIIG